LAVTPREIEREREREREREKERERERKGEGEGETGWLVVLNIIIAYADVCLSGLVPAADAACCEYSECI
jgi:hypothetical protein